MLRKLRQIQIAECYYLDMGCNSDLDIVNKIIDYEDAINLILEDLKKSTFEYVIVGEVDHEEHEPLEIYHYDKLYLKNVDRLTELRDLAYIEINNEFDITPTIGHHFLNIMIVKEHFPFIFKSLDKLIINLNKFKTNNK